MKELKKTLSILAVSLFLALLPVSGQNVKVVSQTCPDCGVTVYGRLLEASDHKPGCKWYVEPETESSHNHESESSWGSSAYSDSNSFGLIEGKPLTNDEYYELLIRTHCDYCGGELGRHKRDCIVGKAYNMWQDAMHSGREWDAIRLRDNVVTLMLGTTSGMDKIHAMRGVAAPRPDPAPVAAEKPSTKLRDYTPAPEMPAVRVSAPLIPGPLAQPAPEFSGINEHAIVYDKPQSLSAQHPWGEVDMNEMRRVKSLGYLDFLSDYDIERYTNTPGGTVVLGKRTPEGKTLWMVLQRNQESGKYTGFVMGDTEDSVGKMVSPQDVRFEAEGSLVVMEFSGGYKVVKTIDGVMVVRGYNIEVLPLRVDGHPVISWKQDPSWEGKTFAKETRLYNDKGQIVAEGEQLEYYDDAVIARMDNGTRATLYNWQGGSIFFDVGGWNTDRMDDIRCYNSERGSYYVIKIREGRYALFAKGFRQVGGIYASADEAHETWKQQ